MSEPWVGHINRRNGLHWVVLAVNTNYKWTNYHMVCLETDERDVWSYDTFYECQKLTLDELPTDVLLRAEMGLLTRIHRHFAENMNRV